MPVNEARKVFDGVTLTAGAAAKVTKVVACDTADGIVLAAKITNGATGPTVPATVSVEVSPNGTDWYSCGDPITGSTENNGVASGIVQLPAQGFRHVRVTAGGNTAQNVTVDAHLVIVRYYR